MNLPKRVARPASWAKLDTIGKFPVPFIAARFPDGRIELASRDPYREAKVNECDLCHLCGELMNEEPSVLLSGPQLSVGVATEPRGHYGCIAYATSICPHLIRGGPQIIVTCNHVVGARRPLLRAVNNYVTILGEVRNLAIVNAGWLVWHLCVEEDEEGRAGREDYANLARIGMLEAAAARVKGVPKMGTKRKPMNVAA